MEQVIALCNLNKHLLTVAKSINPIVSLRDDKPIAYIRMEERPYVLTEETKRVCQVVTAHNLSQYRNKFYSIKVEEEIVTWLDKLLQIDSVK